MRASFNVLHDPWIPIVDMKGERRELGVLDTLRNAHELRAVSDASPMVEYSVYRFLTVLLMDALRPEELEDLAGLLEEGRFDAEKLNEYVETCEKEGVSFDLFDEENPFMQTPIVPEWDRKTKPAAVLDYAVPSGNNHLHFDHQVEREAYSAAKSMRMMLAAQMFCTSAAQGYPSNVNGAPPWLVLIDGDNLFETLVLNMVCTDQIRIAFDEPPVIWRNTGTVESKRKVAQTSWLYGMIFPARRIHLVPGEDGTVTEVYLSQGMNYVDPANWQDPHVVYIVNDKGKFNWKPAADFSVWQNLASLINTRHQCAPQTLANYRELHTYGVVRLTMYAVATSQASYLQSARIDLRLPLEVVGDENAEEFITSYTQTAKVLSKTVSSALKYKEIPEVVRRSAVREYYTFVEQNLFELLNRLSVIRDGYSDLLREAEEQLLSELARCTQEKLSELTLRGRALVDTAELRQKEINSARKFIRRKWENG